MTLAMAPLGTLYAPAQAGVLDFAGEQLNAAHESIGHKLGAVWNFLWEGGEMRIEDSVRQSAYFGFHRTKQIVLDVLVGDVSEVSWIFTLDEG